MRPKDVKGPEDWTESQEEQYAKSVGRERDTIREDIAIRLLSEHDSYADGILEVGCGEGFLVNKLRGYGFASIGFDLPQVIKKAKVRFPEDNFREFNAETGHISPLKNRYDAIIALEVIEHLVDDIGFLQRCNEASNLIILCTPNQDKIAPDDHHLRAYSRFSMEKLMKVAGYKPVDYLTERTSHYFVGERM